MTNDYKEQLINYITNNVNEETGNNVPIVSEDSGTKDIDHIGFITNMLNEEGYSSNAKFTEIGKLQFTNSDKILVYGNIIDNITGEYGGVIIIADENYNYIQYITSFSSGTKLNRFETLNVDETNLVYGVDYTSDGNKRFLLLNDIISSYLLYGEYRCILRRSYFFPSNYNLSDLTIFQTYKKYSNANYLFIGHQQISGGVQPVFNPVIITVSVNVGEENEWNRYTINSYGYMGDGFGSFCSWQNDTLLLKFGCTNSLAGYYEEYSFDGTSITHTNQFAFGGTKQAILIINSTTTYLISSSNGTITYKMITGSSIETIKAETLVASGTEEIFETYVVNGLVFLLIKVNDNNSDDTYQELNLVLNGEVYINQIENVELYAPFTTQFVNLSHDFIVVNYYNLYKMYYSGKYQGTSENPRSIVGSSSLDYNSNNYNGLGYSDYNSLMPKKGRLYDGNGMIFARNLYNKTQINNSTTSTIQIPNTMLNNITIGNKELLGKTNLLLVQDNNSITKNIYETLFINFINTLNVIDEDTNTNYPNTANYINTNINIGTSTNCGNTACTKYRINYVDNTTATNSIVWSRIDKYNKETSISIYVDKAMKSIDLISNNASTVYLNIPLDVEVGKYYTIKQKLRTGDKPVPVQLKYNNEDINYNNEPVMVYTKE